MLLREARKAEQTGFPGQSIALSMKGRFYRPNRAGLESFRGVGGWRADFYLGHTKLLHPHLSLCRSLPVFL